MLKCELDTKHLYENQSINEGARAMTGFFLKKKIITVILTLDIQR